MAGEGITSLHLHKEVEIVTTFRQSFPESNGSTAIAMLGWDGDRRDGGHFMVPKSWT